ncbi:MAG: sigma-70 family RNA polymerase sigma factor [Candidatus Howiella sp.]|jgi:RNA polymerase sigma factor (sigma-70 family)
MKRGTRLISLDIFGDRYPWEGESYSAGDNSETIAKMKRAVIDVMEEELTVRQREVVEDYYFKNMTVTEIAQKRGVNKSTISRHLKRARTKIKKCLKYGFYSSGRR